jgi:FKBP12-rapamycin binding domain
MSALMPCVPCVPVFQPQVQMPKPDTLCAACRPQVSQELIRMAILWHEMWHEALEEASRLYFGESNVAGMLAVLTPLHEMMDKMGATTLKEIAFVQVRSCPCRQLYDFTTRRCHIAGCLRSGGCWGAGS